MVNGISLQLLVLTISQEPQPSPSPSQLSMEIQLLYHWKFWVTRPLREIIVSLWRWKIVIWLFQDRLPPLKSLTMIVSKCMSFQKLYATAFFALSCDDSDGSSSIHSQ